MIKSVPTHDQLRFTPFGELIERSGTEWNGLDQGSDLQKTEPNGVERNERKTERTGFPREPRPGRSEERKRR